jgi:hypothetical protein
MEVLGLWRHAVKSLQGERLESARLEDDGLVGDRRWGDPRCADGPDLDCPPPAGTARRGRVL